MRLGLPRATALAVPALIAAIGCGATTDTTPDACLEGSGTYIRALAEAPAEVRLRGDVPISDCLAENQKGGELANVGAAMIGAATRLNAEARDDPGGPANLQLGYLVGAAKRGSEDTAGIHAELVRRLEAAATYSPRGRQLDTAFQRSYEEGREAGLARG